MSLLRITKYGERVLKRKAKSVSDLNGDLHNLIDNMYQTMYAASGIGLAAPQVDIPLRLAVVNVTPDDRKKQFVMINPVIVKKEGKIDSEEGCLSLPGAGGVVIKRAARVTVEALNEKGIPVTIKGEGLLARCLQHEIDHLNGTMIINRAPFRQKWRMHMNIRDLKKQGLW